MILVKMKISFIFFLKDFIFLQNDDVMDVMQSHEADIFEAARALLIPAPFAAWDGGLWSGRPRKGVHFR